MGNGYVAEIVDGLVVDYWLVGNGYGAEIVDGVVDDCWLVVTNIVLKYWTEL